MLDADDPLVFARAVSARLISSIHEGVVRASGGQVLGTILGMPVVLLTTTGRRTGQPRTAVLTAPILEEHRIVVVASNGGSSRHPAWFQNVTANPAVSVFHAGRTRAMRAHVASSAERADLWPLVAARYVGYDLYQRDTEREIPLVILED